MKRKLLYSAFLVFLMICMVWFMIHAYMDIAGTYDLGEGPK